MERQFQRGDYFNRKGFFGVVIDNETAVILAYIDATYVPQIISLTDTNDGFLPVSASSVPIFLKLALLTALEVTHT